MYFNETNIKRKVIYLTEATDEFSDVYIAVRKKENRVLSDETVAKLPYLKTKEWQLRKKSAERFTTYLTSKTKPLHILDIGCGNGWFSNAIAKVSEQNTIIGLDVNSEELEQAVRLFKKENLKFVYANIFETKDAFIHQFDVITLNASVQYFSDFDVLFSNLKSFLKPKGEIHIIDSPFYNTNNIVAAKQRTLHYYTELGFPEMANHYFHHSTDKVSEFEILYAHKKNLIKKILGIKDSPFSWYCYLA